MSDTERVVAEGGPHILAASDEENKTIGILRSVLLVRCPTMSHAAQLLTALLGEFCVETPDPLDSARMVGDGLRSVVIAYMADRNGGPQ